MPHRSIEGAQEGKKQPCARVIGQIGQSERNGCAVMQDDLDLYWSIGVST